MKTVIGYSIDYYFSLRAISDNSESPALVPTDNTEKTAYINSNGIKWGNAATTAAKMKLIAIQKWTNYSVLQPLESWAEIRRTKLPALNFQVDNTNAQTLPPVRWFYPSSENTYNTTNYQAVSAKDKLTTKIFWDVN